MEMEMMHPATLALWVMSFLAIALIALAFWAKRARASNAKAITHMAAPEATLPPAFWDALGIGEKPSLQSQRVAFRDRRGHRLMGNVLREGKYYHVSAVGRVWRRHRRKVQPA